MRIKRKALTMSDKLEILRKHDENTTLNQKQLADSLGIPSSTLRSVIKNRESYTTNASFSQCKRMKLKSGKHKELEKVLIDWIHNCRNTGAPVSGPVIQKKAREIASMLNIEFSTSNGWLDRFKKRHALVYHQTHRESNSTSEWSNNVLPNLISRFEPRDIFNVDECGLFFKLMPDKYCVFKGEKCDEGKFSQERVTLLIGANSDGSEKLPLVVIGESAEPRCFKNVKNLPCVYKSQARAWMDGDLFVTWLRDLDNKMLKAGRKILLFVDDCSAHPKNVELKNVELAFLPPCTTAMQPMDHGIIKVFKHFYRKRIVLRYLQNIENGQVKPVTLLDAVNYISAAWEAISTNTIADCFRKAGFNKDPVSSSRKNGPAHVNFDDDQDWAAVREQLGDVNMEDFISIDDLVLTSAVAAAPGEGVDGDDSEEPVPSRQDAFAAMRIIRQFISASDTSTNANWHLNCIENMIVHCTR